MANIQNDNFDILAGKPIDKRFGPFLSINDVIDKIPRSYRYAGLIFAIYKNIFDLKNSDLDYYYFYGDFSDTEYKRLLIPPVHKSYLSINDMISDQAEQLQGFIYYDHENNIYYVYLGTNNNDIDDYNIIGDSDLISGHIIVDNEGNQMPQQTELRFNRMLVTDDNSQTIITRPPSTVISIVPPSDPLEGDEWINSVNWKKYAYYDTYWVEQSIKGSNNSTNSGTVTLGAGLSIDDVGRIQLGNDGAGVIDISDTDVFGDGFEIKHQDSELLSNFKLFSDQIDFGIRYNDGENTGSVRLIASQVSQVNGGENSFSISRTINGNNQSLEFFNESSFQNKIILIDQINSKGIEYASDYSANWTDHSLVTKKWVTDNFSGGGSLSVGAGLSINGANNIQLGRLVDALSSYGNLNYIDLVEYGSSSKFGIFSDFSAFDTGGSYSGLNIEGNNNLVSFNSQNTFGTILLSIQSSSFGSFLEQRIVISRSDSANELMFLMTSDSGGQSIIDLTRNIGGFVQGISFEDSSLDGFVKIIDRINYKGLEEADDYSANKTDFSYITPAWLKYQSGYNSSVPQYFTHDSSGNFSWVNI